ncbi:MULTISPECIES: acyl-CoA thioester hydrolase/BAAT C-terminal domain-containing protein [unclassified Chelatococcus]|uniref:acyl-CoA thioesterase/BAAT N-terminal domain-containing protein n=1 Tax=unclassified Chelatococcus TaxID=2638111 RepID=UPI001BCC6C93|nr:MULTISPECIES: acyl-CoA thioester hydrolase/BAAT C-terminal domain-containing protein [unclassified Chelatococcus]CAH1658239.1 Acyl-CoA thioester hydrolase/BAAT N-terminal region [Hyphomicrobiales bacterium]MBS7742199.1 acyl-CoA thioesterase/BAAT N-terminal domain-containing protein [Chelatococcus sp. HY11]MBX3542683.1 acyl-CoA thioesterase/BAAT N-terminal domain-containing protein [Chelatococcus sp.]MCO5075101.1 acyl-CoA thioesterase/BAAT N-terminal domain-containing protein [Chelatococcus s
MSAPVLTVSPADGLIDLPRQILVTGLKPDELVAISARTRRAQGIVWDSQATFMADAAGTVDLSRDAPAGGDYAEVSAMGLLWAQYPATTSQDMFVDDVMEPLVTELTAVTSDDQRLSAKLVQRFAGAGVARREIRDEGLVGTLFTPAGPGPHPVVVVLNGSGGGINEPRGALYASHGYQAFALGYFKAPGLSPYITETPLEYFEAGLRWARRNLVPRDGFVAVSGQSRGGELALLLGATFPDLVSAVIAYVPGAMVHGAQGAGDPARGGWKGVTWTRGGVPLPHLWQDNAAVHWHPWAGDAPPDRHHSVFFEGLKDRALAALARIPVERISGPVLLISGRDDRAWPSSLYSRMVVATLRTHMHRQPVIHLDFDDAGHSINLPFVPTTQLSREHPVSKVPFTSGGTPSGNAKADEGSWRGVLDFLEQVRLPRTGSA